MLATFVQSQRTKNTTQVSSRNSCYRIYYIHVYYSVRKAKQQLSRREQHLYIWYEIAKFSSHWSTFSRERKGNGFIHRNIFIFMCRHHIYCMPSNTKYRMNSSVYSKEILNRVYIDYVPTYNFRTFSQQIPFHVPTLIFFPPYFFRWSFYSKRYEVTFYTWKIIVLQHNKSLFEI